MAVNHRILPGGLSQVYLSAIHPRQAFQHQPLELCQNLNLETWAGCASIQMNHGEKSTWWWQDIGIKLPQSMSKVVRSMLCQCEKKNTVKSSASRNHLNWGADHHVASSSSSSYGTCHWRRPGDPWSVMFDKRSWRCEKKNNKTMTDNNCWTTLAFLFVCPNSLFIEIFSLSIPRFTAHWLPLEQLCGHQSLPTTQSVTVIVTFSWRDSTVLEGQPGCQSPWFRLQISWPRRCGRGSTKDPGFLMNLQSI